MSEYLLMQAEMFLRLVLAALCGVVIGYERKSRGKGAGIRTHLVVATASALMMLISKYGFSDVTRIFVGNIAEYRLDPSRLAAQIVSGVGFLGAGMIYINRKTPHGLTTAAGIWAIAGIGMAIGAGMYIMGILATALIFFAQMILHRDLKIMKMPVDEIITVVTEDSPEAIENVKNLLREYDIHIESMQMRRYENKLIELNMDITTPPDFAVTELILFATGNKYIKAIETGSDHSFKEYVSNL